MGILYCLTVIAMLVTFVLVRKSDKKLNLISWCILSLVSYLAFNILVCMIFGNLNIKTNLVFLSIINLLVVAGLGFKIYKDKKIQTFEIRKRDFIAVVVAFLIVCYMAVEQYTPLSKTVANASVDACNHYTAATHFADEMIILSKIDNKTGYNLKTMQPGAYINTGIFMSVVRSVLPEFKDYVTFKIFEIGVLALNILAFYMLVSDKLKTKKNFAVGLVFLALYAFSYPYTSLLYGFSYLSVAIAFSTGLFYLAKIYDTEDSNLLVKTILILLMGVGIIFSYCLFVPALFAFICIYVFIKDMKKDEKKYLKFFKKSTLLITGVLLVLTILAILYLVVPTFIDTDQNKLTDAIGFVGGSYKSLYQDFLFYIPFVVLFIYKSVKNKELNFQTVALVLLLGQTLICLAGLLMGYVSSYYYYKNYYIIWILLVDIAIEIMCDVGENKELLVLLKAYTIVWILIIFSAVAGWETKLLAKSPDLIESPRTATLAGIYYDTNIFMANNINVSCIVDENRVKMAEAMGEIEDMTLKNMLVGGMNTNCKAWMYVISGIESGGESINDLQNAVVETNVDDFMENKDKKYFVLFTQEEYENTDSYEVVFKNEAGVVLRKMSN